MSERVKLSNGLPPLWPDEVAALRPAWPTIAEIVAEATLEERKGAAMVFELQRQRGSPRGYASDQSATEPVEHKHGAVEEKIWQVLARAQEQLAAILALESCGLTVRLPREAWAQIGPYDYAERAKALAHGVVVIQEDPVGPRHLDPEDT